MIILFSPTKEQIIKEISGSKHKYEDKTLQIEKCLESFSKDELQKILKISDKKFAEYLEMKQNLKKTPALMMYNGISYRQLSRDTYNQKQKDYLQKHVRILSAMYGILRPYDLIKNYRLDYTRNIGFNLYSFWHDEVQSELSETTISLASQEFIKGLSNIIQVHFWNEGKKVHTVEAKKMRAKFLDACVLQNIVRIDDFLDLKIAGYSLFLYDRDNLQIIFAK